MKVSKRMIWTVVLIMIIAVSKGVEIYYGKLVYNENFRGGPVSSYEKLVLSANAIFDLRENRDTSHLT